MRIPYHSLRNITKSNYVKVKTPWNPELVNTLHTIKLTKIDEDGLVRFNFIKEEVTRSKQLFKRYNWPIIDVTRKSVEETAASILKIYEIKKNK